jgi:hypothetical protein
MELQHIPVSKLKISKCNMRYLDPEPDVSEVLPSIRQKPKAELGEVAAEGDEADAIEMRAVERLDLDVALPEMLVRTACSVSAYIE